MDSVASTQPRRLLTRLSYMMNRRQEMHRLQSC